MVSQAIDEDLLVRIQAYVANDINSRQPLIEEETLPMVRAEDVYILHFDRVLNNWRAVTTSQWDDKTYYELVHDAEKNQTLAHIFNVISTQEAII